MRETKRGFTLVELMIVVAIVSILAAIAIPAFLRYIKSTRIAESDMILDWISAGAVSYYVSEQKFSDPVSGDQPWHVGNPLPGQPTSYGMPTGINTFPGGTYEFNTDDGEGNFFECGTSPRGGEKHLGEMTASSLMLQATLKKLKLTPPGPMYFQYAYQAEGFNSTAVVNLVAGADFKPGGQCHEIYQRIYIAPTKDEPVIGPRATRNEFE